MPALTRIKSTARPVHVAAARARGEQYLLNVGLVDGRKFEHMHLLAGCDVGVLGLVGAVLLANQSGNLVGLRHVLRLMEVPHLDPGARAVALPAIGVVTPRIAGKATARAPGSKC